MIKVCSLDFVNKGTFDTDIITESGNVLFCAGDIITPEKIVKLYFKDIYMNEISTTTADTLKVEDAVELETSFKTKVKLENEQDEESISRGLIDEKSIKDWVRGDSLNESEERAKGLYAVESLELKAEDSDIVNRLPRTTELNNDVDEQLSKKEVDMSAKDEAQSENSTGEELTIDDLDTPLEFDEEQANRVATSAIKMGEMLGFSESKLKELEQSAYYHKFGITQFKKRDILDKAFSSKLAIATYELLVNEERMSNNIAEVSKLYREDYASEKFNFEQEIPYCQIVSIASYYDVLLNKGLSKEEACRIMLQLGGNKFNIFILHKFIHIMKDGK